MRCVWVDDCNSTGSSLRDGVKLVKEDYNIDVEKALYLVDRSSDRATMVRLGP
jgi:orotate phosphoribosyltransferase